MLGVINHVNSLPTPVAVIQVGHKIIYGSDAVESAEKEIALYFNQLRQLHPRCTRLVLRISILQKSKAH